jgi:hypothetical protein
MISDDEYYKCEKCEKEIKGWNFSLFDFRPKEGVRASKFRDNYCENCEMYTLFFMGQGEICIPLFDKMDDQDPWKDWNLSDFKSIFSIKKKKLNTLNEEIQSFSKNLFSRIIYSSRLSDLKYKKKSLEEDILELQEKREESIKNIEFYNQLNPNPRCTRCGYDKLTEIPIHSCGGRIVLANDDRKRTSIFGDWSKKMKVNYFDPDTEIYDKNGIFLKKDGNN